MTLENIGTVNKYDKDAIIAKLNALIEAVNAADGTEYETIQRPSQIRYRLNQIVANIDSGFTAITSSDLTNHGLKKLADKADAIIDAMNEDTDGVVMSSSSSSTSSSSSSSEDFSESSSSDSSEISSESSSSSSSGL